MSSKNPFGFEDYSATIENIDLMPVGDNTLQQYERDVARLSISSTPSTLNIPNSQSYDQSPFPASPRNDMSIDAFLLPSPTTAGPVPTQTADQYRALVTHDLAPHDVHTFSWWSHDPPTHTNRNPPSNSDEIEFSPRSLDGGNLMSPLSIPNRYSAENTPDSVIPPPSTAQRRQTILSRFTGLFGKSDPVSPPVSPQNAIPQHLGLTALPLSPSGNSMFLPEEVSHALAKRLSRQPNNVEMWKEQILPLWPQHAGSTRLRSLCHDGIPSSFRGQAWETMLGNFSDVGEEDWIEAGLRAANYESDALKAKFGRETASGNSAQENTGDIPNHLSSTKLIRTDLARTFPDLNLFSEDKPLGYSLMEVLMAFAHYRPEMGYTQGMSYYVAVFLLYMPPPTAFKCFVNIADRDIHSAFFTHDMDRVNAYFSALDFCFAQTQPRLHRAVRALHVEPSMYAYEWLQCAFAKALPLTSLLRIWDLYMEAGNGNSGSSSTASVAVLFRCALALLRIAEETIIPALLIDRTKRRERRSELQRAAAVNVVNSPSKPSENRDIDNASPQADLKRDTEEEEREEIPKSKYDSITADSVFDDDGCGEDEITFDMLVNVLSKPFTVNEDELILIFDRIPLSDRAIGKVIEGELNKVKLNNKNKPSVG